MTDHLTETLATRVVELIDLDHLARRIADHIRQTQLHETTDPNQPIEADQIRRELGAHKPQGRISYPTFQRNYIDTGLLHYVPGPNRAKRYINAGDWQRLKSQINQQKKK